MPFVGAIPAPVRSYLVANAQAFGGKRVVVGCSGNFTCEAILAKHARAASIHSNDVSLYSVAVGRHLTGERLDLRLVDPEYEFALGSLEDSADVVATVSLLQSMASVHRRRNPYEVAIWDAYRTGWADLHAKTKAKVLRIDSRCDEFFAGDVRDHFARFEDDPEAVFLAFAPTYAGGYETMYRNLEKIVSWDPPSYRLLDTEGAKELKGFLAGRPFLWFADRAEPEFGLPPVAEVRQGRRRTIWLYARLPVGAAFIDQRPTSDPAVALPVMPSTHEITERSTIELRQFSDAEMAACKDRFYAKNVKWVMPVSALRRAVFVDGYLVGAFEIENSKYGDKSELYALADFAVPATRYSRLAKLVVMAMLCAETRVACERHFMQRCVGFMTTAFTERPVSMKYRGVLELVKRGRDKDSGEAFLNYRGAFTDEPLREVFRRWIRKHSMASSKS